MRHRGLAAPALAALALAVAPRLDALGAQGAPAQPAANTAGAAPAVRAANAAAAANAALLASVAASMREAWGAMARKDSARFADLIAEGSTSVGHAGVRPMTRAAVGRMLRACDTRSWNIDSLRVRALSPTLTLATYTATVAQTCGGRAQPPRYYVSDVLELRGGRWTNVHHHETTAGGTTP
jgi:uncharacterized protein (TIGR02246 family)